MVGAAAVGTTVVVVDGAGGSQSSGVTPGSIGPVSVSTPAPAAGPTACAVANPFGASFEPGKVNAPRSDSGASHPSWNDSSAPSGVAAWSENRAASDSPVAIRAWRTSAVEFGSVPYADHLPPSAVRPPAHRPTSSSPASRASLPAPTARQTGDRSGGGVGVRTDEEGVVDRARSGQVGPVRHPRAAVGLGSALLRERASRSKWGPARRPRRRAQRGRSPVGTHRRRSGSASAEETRVGADRSGGRRLSRATRSAPGAAPTARGSAPVASAEQDHPGQATR